MKESFYTMTMQARTVDELDISALETSIFRILPISPLPVPKALRPLKGRILGIDYFKENQTLIFARDKVPEAENHVLKVRNVRGKAGAALQACIFTGLYLELNMDCIFPLRSLFSRIVPEPSLFPGWRF